MDAMVLLEGSELRALYRAFGSKQRTLGRGLTLPEFLATFMEHADVQAGQGPAVTKLLVDLFRQIDVNGDSTLEWSEFVGFCIEAGSVASLVKIQRPTFFFMYDARWEDHVSRCSEMQLLHYVRNMDCVVTIEAKSRHVNFFTSRLQLLRRLDTSAANRTGHLTSASTSALPLQLVILTHCKMVAVLLSSHEIAVWTIGLHAFVFHGSLRPPATSIAPCALAYDPVSKTLLVGCSDGSLLVYDVEALRFLWTARSHNDILLDMVALPQRALCATAALDTTVLVWDLERKRALRRFAPPAPVDKLVNVPSLDLLMGKTAMGIVIGWDLAVGEQCLAIEPVGADLVDVALLESAPSRLVTLDKACVMRVWELALFNAGTCPCIMTVRLEGMKANVPRMCCLTVAQRFRGRPDLWMAEQKLAFEEVAGSSAGGGDAGDGEDLGATAVGDLVIAAPRLHRVVSLPQDSVEPPAAVVYNPIMAHMVAVAQRDVTVYDYETGRAMGVFSTAASPTHELCAGLLDDRNRKLYIGRQDGLLLVMNLQNGAIMKQSFDALPAFAGLAYDRQDRLVIAAGGKSVAVFDDEDQSTVPALRWVRQAHDYDITAMGYSEMQCAVVTGDASGRVKVLAAEDLKVLAELHPHRGSVTAVSVVDAVAMVLTADTEGVLVLWTCRGHDEPYRIVYRFAAAAPVLSPPPPAGYRAAAAASPRAAAAVGIASSSRAADSTAAGAATSRAVLAIAATAKPGSVSPPSSRHGDMRASRGGRRGPPSPPRPRRALRIVNGVRSLEDRNPMLAANAVVDVLRGNQRLLAIVDQLCEDAAMKLMLQGTVPSLHKRVAAYLTPADLSLTRSATLKMTSAPIGASAHSSPHKRYPFRLSLRVESSQAAAEGDGDSDEGGGGGVVGADGGAGPAAAAAGAGSATPRAALLGAKPGGVGGFVKASAPTAAPGRSKHALRVGVTTAQLLHLAGDDDGSGGGRWLIVAGNELGEVRLMDASHLLRRLGVVDVAASAAALRRRSPRIHASYESRRQTHRQFAGCVITDEQWFFSDDYPSHDPTSNTAQRPPSATALRRRTTLGTTAAAAAVAGTGGISNAVKPSGAGAAPPATGEASAASEAATLLRSLALAHQDSDDGGGSRQAVSEAAATADSPIASRRLSTRRLSLDPEYGDVVLLRTITAHSDAITALQVFAPPIPSDGGDVEAETVPGAPQTLAGTYVMTAGGDGRVLVWGAAEGALAGEVGCTPADEDAIAAGLKSRVPWKMPPRAEAEDAIRAAEADELYRDIAVQLSARRAKRRRRRSLMGLPLLGGLPDSRDSDDDGGEDEGGDAVVGAGSSGSGVASNAAGAGSGERELLGEPVAAGPSLDAVWPAFVAPDGDSALAGAAGRDDSPPMAPHASVDAGGRPVAASPRGRGRRSRSTSPLPPPPSLIGSDAHDLQAGPSVFLTALIGGEVEDGEGDVAAGEIAAATVRAAVTERDSRAAGLDGTAYTELLGAFGGAEMEAADEEAEATARSYGQQASARQRDVAVRLRLAETLEGQRCAATVQATLASHGIMAQSLPRHLRRQATVDVLPTQADEVPASELVRSDVELLSSTAEVEGDDYGSTSADGESAASRLARGEPARRPTETAGGPAVAGSGRAFGRTLEGKVEEGPVDPVVLRKQMAYVAHGGRCMDKALQVWQNPATAAVLAMSGFAVDTFAGAQVVAAAGTTLRRSTARNAAAALEPILASASRMAHQAAAESSAGEQHARSAAAAAKEAGSAPTAVVPLTFQAAVALVKASAADALGLGCGPPMTGAEGERPPAGSEARYGRFMSEKTRGVRGSIHFKTPESTSRGEDRGFTPTAATTAAATPVAALGPSSARYLPPINGGKAREAAAGGERPRKAIAAPQARGPSRLPPLSPASSARAERTGRPPAPTSLRPGGLGGSLAQPPRHHGSGRGGGSGRPPGFGLLTRQTLLEREQARSATHAALEGVLALADGFLAPPPPVPAAHDGGVGSGGSEVTAGGDAKLMPASPAAFMRIRGLFRRLGESANQLTSVELLMEHMRQVSSRLQDSYASEAGSTDGDLRTASRESTERAVPLMPPMFGPYDAAEVLAVRQIFQESVAVTLTSTERPGEQVAELATLKRHPMWLRVLAPDRMAQVNRILDNTGSVTMALPDLFRAVFVMVDMPTISLMVETTAFAAIPATTLARPDTASSGRGKGSRSASHSGGQTRLVSARPASGVAGGRRPAASAAAGGDVSGAAAAPTVVPPLPLSSTSVSSVGTDRVDAGSGGPTQGTNWEAALTPQLRTDLTVLFETLDTDKSGTVSLSELRAAFTVSQALRGDRDSSNSLGNEDIIAVMQEYDDNANAELDLDEFLHLMAEATLLSQTHDVDGKLVVEAEEGGEEADDSGEAHDGEAIDGGTQGFGIATGGAEASTSAAAAGSGAGGRRQSGLVSGDGGRV